MSINSAKRLRVGAEVGGWIREGKSAFVVLQQKFWRAGTKALWVALVLSCVSAALLAQPPIKINEYTLPHSGGIPWALTAGPDGAIWYTASYPYVPTPYDAIARITTNGKITEYPLPGASHEHEVYGIAAGSDGALWFTELVGNKIGRITTTGSITEFPLPTPNARPYEITAGPDGALWFTELYVGKIGRITTTGVVTEYDVEGACCSTDPTDIVTGSDGALWFTNVNSNWIGRISTQGDITKYSIPVLCFDFGITAGPANDLWFTCGAAAGDMIGRITTSGAFTMYSVPTKNAAPIYITLGSDGALWFTEQNRLQIGRVTTQGAFTEYPAGIPGGAPVAITTGPDGAVWFTEGGAGKIAQAVLGKAATSTLLISSLNPSIYGQKLTWAAMVTSSATIAPTGSVVLNGKDMYGSTFVIGRATLDSSGVATLIKSNLNANVYQVTAVYLGDTMNQGSTSSVLNHVIKGTTSRAVLNSSRNPASQGQLVTLTATITSPTVTPTGPVTFTVGKQVLGTAQIVPWAHKATLAISTLPVGSTVVTVTYLGDSNIAKSSASLTQTVQ